MIKQKIVTAALVAVGLFAYLEYTSVAQPTTPGTEPTTPTTGTEPTTPTTQPTTPTTQPTTPTTQPTTPTTQPTTPTTQPTAPTTQPTTPTTQPTTPATQQNQTNLSALDREFMLQAAQGGMAEVRLGQLASERAVSDEVKQYGQRMVKEHTQVNSQLAQLATQKGVTLPQDVNANQKALRARLGQIPGRRFDRVYMNEAGIKSHAEQAALFQREAQQGQDPDVKAFAARILPAIEDHLQDARAMTGTTTGANPNRPATAQ